MPDEPGPRGGRPARAARPEPLATDGVAAVAVGTALWGAALVVTLVLRGTLSDDGRLWWVATCVCGVVLGLVGLAYSVRRRDSLRRDGQDALDEALGGVTAREPGAGRRGRVD